MMTPVPENNCTLFSRRLPDMGLYCLNTIRFILGEQVTAVFAWRYSTPGDPQFAEVEEPWPIKFPGGIIAACSTDDDVHETRRYRVMCGTGWMNLENAYAYKEQKLGTSRAGGKLKRQEEVVRRGAQVRLAMSPFKLALLPVYDQYSSR